MNTAIAAVADQWEFRRFRIPSTRMYRGPVGCSSFPVADDFIFLASAIADGAGLLVTRPRYPPPPDHGYRSLVLIFALRVM